MRPAIGVDVGGTKVLTVAVRPDDPDRVVAEHREPTPRGVDALVAAIGRAVARVSDAIDTGAVGADSPDAIGLGIPGLVDHAGVFRYGPNLPDVVDVDLAERLRAATGRDASVANDASCAALAEFRCGAGVGHAHGLLITLGTGIGGGLVVDGRLLTGAHGFAGDPGHMVIDPAGPRCPCGRQGCWERYGSGSALGRMAQEAVADGRGAVLARLADDGPVGGEHVVAAARSGDGSAAAIIEDFGRWVAMGVGNLIDLLDPSIVVLGGGVMAAADVVLPAVVGAMDGQVMGEGHRPPVDVVAATLGERAGAIGAALLAAERQSP